MKLHSDNWKRTLTLLPSLILVGVFVYGFIAQTVWVSLTDWGGDAALASKPKSVGFEASGFRWLSSRVSILQFNWQNLPRIVAVIAAIGLVIRSIRLARRKGWAMRWFLPAPPFR